MGTLSKNKLIEYIRHAIDLESAVVTQEFIKREYVNISQANKPKLPVISSPNKPNYKEVPAINDNLNATAYLSIVSGIIFLIVVACVDISYNGGLTEISLIMLLIIVMPLIIFGWLLRMRTKSVYNDAQSYNISVKDKYERDMSDYENKIRSNQQKYRDSMTLWQASDTEALAFIDEHLDEAHSDANKYYARNVIFEKYRNLPALTSIYEYLLSGRCDGLEGPNGAYNIYEMEVRQNTVISQLNVIIENLEQIKQNQYILYGELVKISNETSAITAEMRRISGYTYSLVQLSFLNAYYSTAAASAASAMAFDMALR